MKLKRRQSNEQTDYRDIGSRIVDVDQVEEDRKEVIYGKSGTGKTTYASTYPTPILLLDINEKGTKSVQDVKGLKVLKVTGWQDLEDAYWYVKKKPGKFRSVVIDNLSQAQDMAIKQVLTDHGKGDKEVGGWGTMTRKEWGKVSTMMKEICYNFRDLDGVHVCFIAHDRLFNAGDEDDDNEGQIAPEVGPRLMPSIASSINAAVGVIGNTFVRERTVVKKIGKKKIEKRRVEYCMRIGPHAYYTTKLRKPRGVAAPAYIVDPTFEKVGAVMDGKEVD